MRLCPPTEIGCLPSGRWVLIETIEGVLVSRRSKDAKPSSDFDTENADLTTVGSAGTVGSGDARGVEELKRSKTCGFCVGTEQSSGAVTVLGVSGDVLLISEPPFSTMSSSRATLLMPPGSPLGRIAEVETTETSPAGEAVLEDRIVNLEPTCDSPSSGVNIEVRVLYILSRRVDDAPPIASRGSFLG